LPIRFVDKPQNLSFLGALAVYDWHAYMDTQLKDFELIEKANLGRNATLAANIAIGGLRYLKGLSKRLGIPMDDITAEQIIQECAREDAENREMGKRLGLP
jgi:hypothetical protein